MTNGSGDVRIEVQFRPNEARREWESRTVQLAARGDFGQDKVEWRYALAGALLAITPAFTPAIISYLALQRRIIEGRAAGAAKGWGS